MEKAGQLSGAVAAYADNQQLGQEAAHEQRRPDGRYGRMILTRIEARGTSAERSVASGSAAAKESEIAGKPHGSQCVGGREKTMVQFGSFASLGACKARGSMHSSTSGGQTCRGAALQASRRARDAPPLLCFAKPQIPRGVGAGEARAGREQAVRRATEVSSMARRSRSIDWMGAPVRGGSA